MFKLIQKIVNPEYDPNRADNGGCYYQPTYIFIFNGVKGVFEDTSCGDFGYRYHLEWDGLHANYDEVGNCSSYSHFSCTNIIHMELLVNIHKVTGWRVPTCEEYTIQQRQVFNNIFENASFITDLCVPIKGDVLLKYSTEIANLMNKVDYIYWLSDDIKLNPNGYYQLWTDKNNRTYGFRREDNKCS